MLRYATGCLRFVAVPELLGYVERFQSLGSLSVMQTETYLVKFERPSSTSGFRPSPLHSFRIPTVNSPSTPIPFFRPPIAPLSLAAPSDDSSFPPLLFHLSYNTLHLLLAVGHLLTLPEYESALQRYTPTSYHFPFPRYCGKKYPLYLAPGATVSLFRFCLCYA